MAFLSSEEDSSWTGHKGKHGQSIPSHQSGDLHTFDCAKLQEVPRLLPPAFKRYTRALMEAECTSTTLGMKVANIDK